MERLKKLLKKLETRIPNGAIAPLGGVVAFAIVGLFASVVINMNDRDQRDSQEQAARSLAETPVPEAPPTPAEERAELYRYLLDQKTGDESAEALRLYAIGAHAQALAKEDIVWNDTIKIVRERYKEDAKRLLKQLGPSGRHSAEYIRLHEQSLYFSRPME